MPPRSAINALPAHVLDTHVLRHLNIGSLRSLQSSHRTGRAAAGNALERLRVEREQEMADLAGAIKSANRRASGHTRSGEIFKELIDRLPRPQFKVTGSVFRPGRPAHGYVQGFGRYSGTIETKHLKANLEMAWVRGKAIGNIWFKTKPVAGHFSVSLGVTPPEVHNVGFPKRLASIAVAKLLGRRRTSRSTRVLSGSYANANARNSNGVRRASNPRRRRR